MMGKEKHNRKKQLVVCNIHVWSHKYNIIHERIHPKYWRIQGGAKGAHAPRGSRQKQSNQSVFGLFLSKLIIQHPVAQNPAYASAKGMKGILKLSKCKLQI